LAISIVVTLLAVTDFVAGQQHRHALGEQQRRQVITLLTVAQGEDGSIVGRSFDAAVPAVVAIRSVAVVLLVGLVVLMFIANEVTKGKAAVSGDEVDARPGPAAAMVKDVTRGAKARRDLANDAAVAAPEAADRVAVAVVPLRPIRREAAKPVAVGA